MGHLVFVIWMLLFYPCSYLADAICVNFLGDPRPNEYDTVTQRAVAVIRLSIWAFVGWLLY